MMTGFFSALQLLTVLPAPLAQPTERPSFSLACFPLVGLLLGAILAGLDWSLRQLVPETLANGLLIIALIGLTGGLHLDGFMDTCDALPGAQPPARRLEILKDMRVGSYGVLGLLCLIMAKYLALSSLPASLRWSSLLAMPVLGRWSMALAIIAFPYIRAGGLGSAIKEGANGRSLALAATLALGISTLVLQAPGALAWAGAGALSLFLGWLFVRRLSGLTGDTYGAINEVAEVAVLILVLAAWGARGGQP